MLLQDGFVEEKSYCSGCRCFGHLSYQLHFRPEKEFSCPWTMATVYFPLRYRWSLFHTPRACAHMFTVHRLRSVVLCIRHHRCAVTLQTICFISRSVCSICVSQWRIKFFSVWSYFSCICFLAQTRWCFHAADLSSGEIWICRGGGFSAEACRLSHCFRGFCLFGSQHLWKRVWLFISSREMQTWHTRAPFFLRNVGFVVNMINIFFMLSEITEALERYSTQ